MRHLRKATHNTNLAKQRFNLIISDNPYLGSELSVSWLELNLQDNKLKKNNNKIWFLSFGNRKEMFRVTFQTDWKLIVHVQKYEVRKLEYTELHDKFTVYLIKHMPVWINNVHCVLYIE